MKTRIVLALAGLIGLATLLSAQTAYQYGALANSISAATTTCAPASCATAYAIPVLDGHEHPGRITWQYTFAGGAQPTSHTTGLYGSIDGTNYYLLDSSSCITCTFQNGQQGELRHVVNKGVKWLSCGISALTLGSATSESCSFIVEKP